MPITLQTQLTDTDERAQEYIERLHAVLLRRAAYVGERCITKARQCGSYKDRTGNLRSSVGYIIVDDGKIVGYGGFAPVSAGSDSAEGVQTGRQYAESLASRYTSGIALIVVAGMHYATYVENRGRDVLTSARLMADELFNTLNQQK